MFLEHIDAKLGQEDVSLVMQVRMARVIKGFATVLAYLLPIIVGAATLNFGLCSVSLHSGITCTENLFYIGAAMLLVMCYKFAVFVYLIGAFFEWRAMRRLLPYQRSKKPLGRVTGENPVTRL